jgi:hypothetical protein
MEVKIQRAKTNLKEMGMLKTVHKINMVPFGKRIKSVSHSDLK